MYNNLLKKIIDFDQITIFRHIRPDGDAMFSCLALYQFIKDNFKNKKVKIAGKDTYDVITKIDKVSDSYINESLAIILDTSNVDRVDDKRFINAEYVIKIDHHPAIEQFGDLNIVNSDAAACAELLADIFMSKPFSKYKLSKKVCEYLYCGILTDSMDFSTTSTTPITLSIGSKLALIGNLKINELNNYVFSKNIDLFEKITKIRSYLKIDGKFAYIFLDRKDLKKIQMKGSDARNNIDAIANIKGINIWAFFTYNEENGLYDGSLRSIRGYVVNEIAYRYNGGGHKNASGTNKLTLQQIHNLIKELSLLANSKDVKRNRK